jgi:hypothetical protein
MVEWPASTTFLNLGREHTRLDALVNEVFEAVCRELSVFTTGERKIFVCGHAWVQRAVGRMNFAEASA